MTLQKQNKDGQKQKKIELPGPDTVDVRDIAVPRSAGSGHIRIYPFHNGLELVLVDCSILQHYVFSENRRGILYIMAFCHVTGMTRAGRILAPGRLYVSCSTGKNLPREEIVFEEGVKGFVLMIDRELYGRDLDRRLKNGGSEKLDELPRFNTQKMFPSICSIMQELFTFSGNEVAEGLFFQSKSEEALAILMAHIPSKKEKKTDVKKGGEAEEIAEVIRYLRAHRNEKCSLDALAHRFCTSTTRLTASFKRNTGMTIKEYRTMLRLEETKRLLTRTDLSQGEIAHTLGFRSVSNFSDFFKRETGVTPKEWRQAAAVSHTAEMPALLSVEV